MAVISMKALLESGVHFGHRTNKWDPKMKPYIFTERNGIHIIDLQQTVKAINAAYAAIREVVSGGGVVMFVGTKRQAQETVQEEAVRCGMPYVTERWLGGMLTNWSTMFQRIQELERMEKLISSSDVDRLTKKEGLLIEREITRLNIRLSGVRSIRRVPDMIFVVDVMREESAVHEANLLGIPVVALVDTNCDPTNVDYVIPSNDDAIRAIKLLVAKIADAVLEGKALRKDEELETMEEVRREGRATIVEDEELEGAIDLEEEEDDALLLGDATLAKLASSKEDSESEEEEDEEGKDLEPDMQVEEKEKPAKSGKVAEKDESTSQETADTTEAVKTESKPKVKAKSKTSKEPAPEPEQEAEKPEEEQPKE